MITEGVPWIILLPLAILFLVWGVRNSKAELAEATLKVKKNRKSKKS
jgi:hypothetical protein